MLEIMLVQMFTIFMLDPGVAVEDQLPEEPRDGWMIQLLEFPEPEPDPEPAIAEHWIRLAECESGNWIDGGASFESGSARWDWAKPGTEVPPWGTRIHHGGLQHHPDTWDWVAGDLGLLEQYPHAYDAPAEIQVQVATEVQRRQGWGAWPVCSRKVGLR